MAGRDGRPGAGVVHGGATVFPSPAASRIPQALLLPCWYASTWVQEPSGASSSTTYSRPSRLAWRACWAASPGSENHSVSGARPGPERHTPHRGGNPSGMSGQVDGSTRRSARTAMDGPGVRDVMVLLPPAS